MSPTRFTNSKMAMVRDFQSFAGPGDRDLKMTEIEGYQPVSRIGEVVMNSFSTLYPLPAITTITTAVSTATVA